MGQLPTVDDVARVAGVSRQTVSNVLNTPAIVKESTRSRVQSAITQLGYRPHASARRLRTQKSSTIGIRMEGFKDGVSGAVLDRFLHALTEQADARDMRILLYTATSPEHEIEQFARLRDGADVDALILKSTFHNDPRTEWLIDNGMPFVTFGRPWGIDDMNDPSHRWVDVDGYAGVFEATRHLIDEGSTRVAFIGWPTPSGTGDERRRGWADAAGHGAVDAAALSVATTDGVPEGSRAALDLLGLDSPPDAIVCASDSLALGAMIASSGRVPIIGYDNTPVAAAVGLSSVDQPLAEAAASTLELLFGENGSDLQSFNEEPKHRLLAPRLVVRRSTHLAPGETTGT
jgi:DNA-binding LacI/PurR family transcriptional regulator